MKKRSEVKGKQETLDNATAVRNGIGPLPKPVVTGNIYACKCGLKQSKGILEQNDGACLRCGEEVDVSKPGEVPEPLRTRAPEADPWLLTPEGQAAAAKEAAKAAAKPITAPGGEETFSILAKKLNDKGLWVTVFHIASMTPEQRAEASAWAMPGVELEMPKHLVEFERDRIDPPKDEPGKKKPSPTPTAKAGEEVVARVHEEAEKIVARTHARRTNDVETIFKIAGETVSATWGEEKFNTKFCTCTIGPFGATTAVREGETREDALARLELELQAHAEEARTRKMRSFLKELASMKETKRNAEAS